MISSCPVALEILMNMDAHTPTKRKVINMDMLSCSLHRARLFEFPSQISFVSNIWGFFSAFDMKICLHVGLSIIRFFVCFFVCFCLMSRWMISNKTFCVCEKRMKLWDSCFKLWAPNATHLSSLSERKTLNDMISFRLPRRQHSFLWEPTPKTTP